MFNLFDCVRVVIPINTSDRKVIPANTEGVILECFSDTDFLVEFLDDAGETVAVVDLVHGSHLCKSI